MGTLFEPFIIAFWVFIIALIAFLIGGVIYAIRDNSHKSKSKGNTKEDETESTEKMKK